MKFLKVIFLAICLSFGLFTLTGCDKDKPQIVFSSTPFSKELGYTPQNAYKRGQKIYYLLYNPNEFKTRLLKISVFRKDPDADEFWGYEYLYNQTLELTDKKFYTDFYIINKAGYYIFQVFDYTNIHKAVITGVVKVEE